MEVKKKQMEVLALLRSKNRCLEKFIEISDKFLMTIGHGHWDGLSQFHIERDSILKAIDLYDRKITEVTTEIVSATKTQSFVSEVRALLDRKDELFHTIVRLDQEIIRHIENEKLKIAKELGENQKSIGILEKFRRSGRTSSGGGIDTKL